MIDLLGTTMTRTEEAIVRIHDELAAVVSAEAPPAAVAGLGFALAHLEQVLDTLALRYTYSDGDAPAATA